MRMTEHIVPNDGRLKTNPSVRFSGQDRGHPLIAVRPISEVGSLVVAQNGVSQAPVVNAQKKRETLELRSLPQIEPVSKNVPTDRSESSAWLRQTTHEAAIRYYQSLRLNGMRPAEAARRAQKFYKRMLGRNRLDELLDQKRETRPPRAQKKRGFLIGGLGTAALLLTVLAVSNLLVRVLSDKIVASFDLAKVPPRPSPTVSGRQETLTASPLVSDQVVSVSPKPTRAASYQAVDWQQANQYYFYFTQPTDRREPLPSVLERLVRYFGTSCGVDVNDSGAVKRFVDRIKQANPGISSQLPSVIKIPILDTGTQTRQTVSQPKVARQVQYDVGERSFSFSISAQGDSAIQHNIRAFFATHPSWKISPGQTQSVNEYFGPYSVDQGMVMGANNVGDGVCNAVSILLYAAAESGLEIEADQPGHEYSIPGVPSEYWTTIYYDTQDAWVHNSFDRPVDIHWQVEGDTLILWVEEETLPTLTSIPTTVEDLKETDVQPEAPEIVDKGQERSEWFDFLITFFQAGDPTPNLAQSLSSIVESGQHDLTVELISLDISPVLKTIIETITGAPINVDQVNFWIGGGLPSDQMMQLARPQDLGYDDILTRHVNALFGLPVAAVVWETPTSNRMAALLLHGNYDAGNGSFTTSYLKSSALPVPEFVIPKHLRGLEGQFAIIFVERDESRKRVIRTYP